MTPPNLPEAAKLAHEALQKLFAEPGAEHIRSSTWDDAGKAIHAVSAALDAALSASAEPMEPVAEMSNQQWQRYYSEHPEDIPEGWRPAVAATQAEAALTPPPQAEPSAQEPVGLSLEQEPKYTVNGSAIFNRASGEAIPADEPVFIFRARDKHAVEVLEFYRDLVRYSEHRDAIDLRTGHFYVFKSKHPERMKEPDTDMSPTPAPQTSASVAADVQAPAEGALSDESTMVDLWAEIHRLRAAVKGPDGYASWQDAAVDERIRRVRAEKALAAPPAQAEPSAQELAIPLDLLDEMEDARKEMQGLHDTWARIMGSAIDWIIGDEDDATPSTQDSAGSEQTVQAPAEGASKGLRDATRRAIVRAAASLATPGSQT